MNNIIASFNSNSEDEWEWDDFKDHLKYSGIKADKFYLSASNMDWRGSEGHAVAKSLEDIAFKLTSFGGSNGCKVEVSFDARKNELNAIVYHHDVPTGTSVNVMNFDKAVRKKIIVPNKYPS